MNVFLDVLLACCFLHLFYQLVVLIDTDKQYYLEKTKKKLNLSTKEIPES